MHGKRKRSSLKRLLFILTGGRPMRQIDYAFMDRVSGRAVFYWQDKLGREWLAEGPWSRFRIPKFPIHDF